MGLLADLVSELGDPELGLKAGEAVEHGDLDVFGEAVSTQPTLRGALEISCRYYRLLHSGAWLSAVRDGEKTVWRYQVHEGLAEPPAVHDFVITSLLRYCFLYTGRPQPQLAVYFAHGDRTNLEAYRTRFRCPIAFDMPFTGVLFPTERLDWTLSHPLVILGEAFEARARAALGEIEEGVGVAGLVRKTLVANMESGEISMTSIARRLALSVPTLRRKLAAEETTHSQILDDVRKELALALLTRDDMSANKVALWLRFADTSAFHRAFRRWTGEKPGEYRQRARS